MGVLRKRTKKLLAAIPAHEDVSVDLLPNCDGADMHPLLSQCLLIQP